MKEIRVDEINNDIVIFAKDRARRPMDKVINENEESIIGEYNKDCPFCKGNEHYTPKSKFKIEDENGWIVRSIDNKFPIVEKKKKSIYGSHEVMIDTYRHNGNFYNMDEDEFYNMLLMYKDRYSNLIKDEKVQYVSIFKNYLRQAGASLNHPHSQIVSISIIPPDIEREINISKQYYIENKRYLYDNIINEEIKEILYDINITTKLKEQIDKVLFSDIDVRKKRIAIRKLKRKGLDNKYIKIFINLLEYIQKI